MQTEFFCILYKNVTLSERKPEPVYVKLSLSLEKNVFDARWVEIAVYERKLFVSSEETPYTIITDVTYLSTQSGDLEEWFTQHCPKRQL